MDNLIIGGILANTFLKAKGIDIKASKYDLETLKLADEILDSGADKILLPLDAVVSASFSESDDKRNRKQVKQTNNYIKQLD